MYHIRDWIRLGSFRIRQPEVCVDGQVIKTFANKFVLGLCKPVEELVFFTLVMSGHVFGLGHFSWDKLLL